MSQAIDGSLATLLTASVKAALLALAAAALLAALRIRNRNVHHRAWCGVLAAMLSLPLLPAVLPTFALPQQLAALWPLATEGSMPPSAAEDIASLDDATRAAVAEAARLGEAEASLFEAGAAGGEQDPELATPRDDERRVERRRAAARTAGSSWLTWSVALFAVYACGVLMFVCRFALGVWAARRLNHHCRPLKLRRFAGARVFECDAVRVPLTLGFLRPRIVLPSDCRNWDGALLASVLRHEQAHVDRRDPLWTALAEINRCLYWFHPLAWLLRRKLATLAETICDDYAVAQVGDRRRYAHHLLEIAGRMTAAPRRVAADAIFMARSSQVESRIDAILDDARPLARRLRPRETFALVVAMASALAVVTCLRAELALAQQPQQRPADGQSAAAAQASPANPGDGDAASAGPQATAVDRYGDPLPPGATTRLGSLRYRHPGFMWKRIAFLPDSQTFAVGGQSQQVRLWDARSGKLVHEIDHGSGQLVAFCVSAAGNEIATLAMADDIGIELVVWNAESWSAVRRAKWDRSAGPRAQQIAYSPDGAQIALVFGDGTLRLWNVASGEEIVRRSPFVGVVESLEFSPSGELLASAGRQGVLLWNVAVDEQPEKLEGLPEGAGVVRFSPDGSLLAVGDYDQAVARLYNVASRQMILAIEGPNYDYSREGMCFSADGRQLIVPNSTNVVDFFDVITAERVRRLETEAIMPRGVDVSPDGRLLASIGTWAAMNVWDLKSGERLSDQATGHLADVFGVAWTPDDELVATASMDGTIRVWNAAGGEQRHVLGHEGWVAAMAVAPGGEALLSCSLDDSLRLWDLATGDQLLKLPGHGRSGGERSVEVAFSPDGNQFYSFGSDLRLNSYDRKTGRRLAQRDIRPSGVTIEEAPDGRPDVHPDPFGDSGARGFSLDQVQFAPDASLLLLGDRNKGKIYTFDVATGREVDVLSTDEPWRDFLLSPDGKRLATFEQPAPTASPTATIVRPSTTLRLRDLASKEVLREVVLPGSYANLAAFSPDGKLIALAQVVDRVAAEGRSWSVAVLSVETLEQIASIEVQPNVLRKLVFSHDGKRLATSRDDSTVLIWDLDQLRTPAGAP